MAATPRAAGTHELRESGAQRILVVPLFRQYCGATTGAAYDQVNAELRRCAGFQSCVMSRSTTTILDI